ncbi:MAG: hypothetical protein LBC04_01385 [Holosporaceae bacterium]|jgi:hypothetical protein|nr:hypothetical protein [Holosporaceae bacterium]
MSEIIYLKDILLAEAVTKKEKKNAATRAKLKPFKYEKTIKSSLIEKRKREDCKR